MAAGVEQALAHGYGVGKGAGLVGHGREDEVAQRVVVEVVEAVSEGARDDAVVVGRHRADALAHVARRDDAAALPQDARRAAVVYHRNDGCHVAAHVEQGAYGHGGARAAAYDNRLYPAHRATPCLVPAPQLASRRAVSFTMPIPASFTMLFAALLIAPPPAQAICRDAR